MEAKQALSLFNVQRFSVHDGDGIRTTIFLKGCPLRCAWCHNPEGLNTKPTLAFTAAQCIGCGVCHHFCEDGSLNRVNESLDYRSECEKCEVAVEQCPARALHLYGQEHDFVQLKGLLARDREFYRQSGGGVTFSGGEPLLQYRPLVDFLDCIKTEHYHIAIETSGQAPYAALEALIPRVDCFFYDIKMMDSALHKRWTGVDNGQILKNFVGLTRAHDDVRVRVPIIPAVNDTEAQMTEIAEFVKDYAISYVELMPYHPLGASKADSIGCEGYFASEKMYLPEELAALKQVFTSYKIPVK